MNPDDVLNTRQVADLYGVDLKTVKRWAKAGRLPSFQTPGGHWRFWRGSLPGLPTAEARRP